ncbi:MAG: hypothetical protein HC821_00495 [Lewinella sp.]|nr:hypothetical protein [Lewinella sp.]
MGGTQGGGLSALQSSIILPAPEAQGRYYLFTMEENEFDLGGNPADQPQGRGLSYFLLDFTEADTGLVVEADVRLFVPAYEGLSATPRADGQGYWVVCAVAGADELALVSVTAAGVSNPQLFPITSPHGGQFKFSPDGRFLFNNGHVFAFNANSGTPAASPLLSLPSVNALTTSFTPQSNFLYTVVSTVVDRRLTRYDLNSPDPLASAAILAIWANDGLSHQMQIGPNGNLYFLEETFLPRRFGLSEITCPGSNSPAVNRFVFDFGAGESAPFTGCPISWTPSFYPSPATRIPSDSPMPPSLLALIRPSIFCPSIQVQPTAGQTGQAAPT